MRRWFALLPILACLVAIACISPAVVLEAQSLPLTIHVRWMPNAPSENVTSYSLTFNGVKTSVPATTALDPACGCFNVTQSVTVAGPQAISLTATNAWGDSPAATLEIAVVVPSKPNGLSVTK